MKELLLRLQESPTAERVAILETETDGDPTLRRRLESLLAAGDESDDRMLEPLVRPQAPSTNEEMPRQIGPYRVEGLLGRGGMACVFRAFQEQPLRRAVALKVVRPGANANVVLRRFEMERQTLALLSHRNIARLYDAGADPYGPAYFVMELVDGPSISRYCEEQGLDLAARLKLFRQVCRGVQHAHARGVLHRDLKPSNILVAIEDGEAIPRIIDFGVAKALGVDSPLADEQHTLEHQIVGTLEYMSPEQAEFGNPRIDARSDVYALGVVLYEMLVGQVPIGGPDFADQSIAEIQKRIATRVPRRPSEAGHRLCPRELDCVVLKSLEKEPERRYQTVKDLADDIERFLDREPLEAREPTALYVLGKFAQRNRGVVTLALLLMSTVILGLIGTSYGLLQSLERSRELEASLNRELQREEELKQIIAFQTDSLANINLMQMGAGIRNSVRDDQNSLDQVNFTDVARNVVNEHFVQQALQEAERRFADQPILLSEQLQSIALVLVKLGLLEQAAEPQQQALAIRTEQLGPDSPEAVASRYRLAVLFAERGQAREALDLINAVVARYDEWGSEYESERLEARNSQATILGRLGRLEEATDIYEQVWQARQRKLGPDDPRTLTSVSNLATALAQRGQMDRAEELARHVYETRLVALGADHPDTLRAHSNLAIRLYRSGKLQESLEQATAALDGYRQAVGDGHPETLTLVGNLATIHSTLGNLDLAIETGREALRLRAELLGRRHPDTLGSMANLAAMLESADRHEEALGYYREALEGRLAVFGEDHPSTLHSINGMGVITAAMGDYEQAETYYRRAYEARVRSLGPRHASTLVSHINLAGVLTKQGRAREGESEARQVLSTARETLPAGHWYIGVFRRELAIALAAQDRFEEAEQEALAAYEHVVAQLGAGHRRSAILQRDIVRIYRDWHAADPTAGHDREALAWQQRTNP